MKNFSSFCLGLLLLIAAGIALSIPGWLRNYDGLAGYVLIASPEVEDPNFRQTVILVTEHNPVRARGYVLNRLQFEPEYATYQRWGGPLAPDHVRLLTRAGGAKSTPIGDTGFYLRSEDPLYDRSVKDIILHGYVAWERGQLEEEIAAENWKILPFTADMLDIPFTIIWEDLWSETL